MDLFIRTCFITRNSAQYSTATLFLRAKMLYIVYKKTFPHVKASLSHIVTNSFRITFSSFSLEN